MSSDRRVWMYRGEEARLFPSLEDVPANEGWSDRPGIVEPPKPKSKPFTKKPQLVPPADEGTQS